MTAERKPGEREKCPQFYCPNHPAWIPAGQNGCPHCGGTATRGFCICETASADEVRDMYTPPAPKTPSPEVGIDAFDFLDAAIDAGRGPVTFGMTDNGNVGVWIFDDADDAKAHGTGDTAEEALLDAAYRGTFPAILAAAKETK